MVGYMKVNKKQHLSKQDGFKDGLPVFIGYFPIAMAFGILSRSTGLTLYETLAFSFIVFAGAAQFIAVGMIAAGVGGLEIVIATLFLNFRHFLMSASLSSKTLIQRKALRPVISFFVTDESFSVASFAGGQLTASYMIPMQLVGYFGWGIGSGVGFILGSILPPMLQKAMEIGLYVMFVALLVPEMKKTNKAITLSVTAGILNTLLRNLLHMPQGWSIVLTIVLVALLGLIVYGEEDVREVVDLE